MIYIKIEEWQDHKVGQEIKKKIRLVIFIVREMDGKKYQQLD